MAASGASFRPHATTRPVPTLENAFGSPSQSAYVDAILGELGDREPLGVLAATPDALAEATAGLNDADARQRERPGKWSVQHVVRHLGDSEIVSGYRFRLIVAHDRPTIAGYDQDLFADRLHYLDATLAETLGDFAAVRGVNVRFLRRLSEGELARAGMHAERGEETAERLVKLMAGHDLVHLRQIARIRETLGV